MNRITIQILSDNRKLCNQLDQEHGLCVYLETDKYNYLLDTGASEKFLKNAELMEIEIEDIDYVFISHGHSDHIGGLKNFLEVNKKAKIIVSKEAVTKKFISLRDGIRILSSDIDVEKYKDRFIFVEETFSPEENVHVFHTSKNDFPKPKANKNLMVDSGDHFVEDHFEHELIFCYGNSDVLVYSGCAHSGVLNILNTVKDKLKVPIKVMIGGFHLLDSTVDKKYETKDEMHEMVQQLNSGFPDTIFYTGHCTGENAYKELKLKLKNRLKWFYTGFTLIMDQF